MLPDTLCHEIGRGTLRDIIQAGSVETGLSMADLTVLSAQIDPYRLDTPVNHRNAGWFAEQVERFAPRIVHLRGLHYRLVASGDVVRPDTGQAYKNDPEAWEFLQDRASKAGRWLGYVPFDRIKDERNSPPEIFVPEALPARGAVSLRAGEPVYVPGIADDLMPDLAWNGKVPRQPYRIVIIGEKSSLGEVLRPIAQAHEAELLLPSGECTDTLIAEMVDRAHTDGRPLVILYFSDFDPSGWQMPTSVARKIQAHRDRRFPDLNADLHHVCLTLEQVRAFDLPSTPLSENEKRANRWREMRHHDQTEIDALAALRPDDLRQIAQDALRPFYDYTLAERWHSVRMEWLSAAAEWLRNQPQYMTARAAMTVAHDHVEAAIDRLRDTQSEAFDQLAQALRESDDTPEPPDDIWPSIEIPPPEPMFTTGDGYVAATRKLVERKRLGGA
jgi:hypothetical protein